MTPPPSAVVGILPLRIRVPVSLVVAIIESHTDKLSNINITSKILNITYYDITSRTALTKMFDDDGGELTRFKVVPEILKSAISA